MQTKWYTHARTCRKTQCDKHIKAVIHLPAGKAGDARANVHMQTWQFMHARNCKHAHASTLHKCRMWRWNELLPYMSIEVLNKTCMNNTKLKTHTQTCTRCLWTCWQTNYKVKVLSTQIHKTLCTCACAVFDTAVLLEISGDPKPKLRKGGARLALQVKRRGRCNSASPRLTKERRHLL